MSRPKKMHKPIKATFSQVLVAVAVGNTRAGKRKALILAKEKKSKSEEVPIKSRED